MVLTLLWIGMQAITALVQESMGYIDATPDDATKERLIVTLKDICEGKIYVEGEGAKFTMMLSKYVPAVRMRN
jgi:26S proteasome regulatory subunit N5